MQLAQLLLHCVNAEFIISTAFYKICALFFILYYLVSTLLLCINNRQVILSKCQILYFYKSYNVYSVVLLLHTGKLNLSFSIVVCVGSTHLLIKGCYIFFTFINIIVSFEQKMLFLNVFTLN